MFTVYLVTNTFVKFDNTFFLLGAPLIVIFLACYVFVCEHKWFVYPIVSTLTYGITIGFIFVMYFLTSNEVNTLSEKYEFKMVVYIYAFYMIIYFVYSMVASFSIKKVLTKKKQTI